uniref:Uncharacterized protein n=1 Tax=Candidatus Kentrum sp. SD TaxID=2126332 RepID=A0A450YQ93_9GAMM|nr:MAG: hypothetical protein BECKSD772F_GA0070984_103911 [Candidatus Kentron sp. SD]VFK43685.1 MAG: hypothetical protein BECKSD772E_GA0070983_102815 [Candidatus Kentron sp. SD]
MLGFAPSLQPGLEVNESRKNSTTYETLKPMYAHRMETTVDETGAVTLDALPFTPGDEVEIIILKRET